VDDQHLDEQVTRSIEGVRAHFPESKRRADYRDKYDYDSRYPSRALRKMGLEAAYLCVVFAIPLVATLFVYLGDLQSLLELTDPKAAEFKDYAYLAAGGLFGGTMFDMKWLYHSRARGEWNEDRVYWRLFVPWLSCGLAFVTGALIKGGFLSIFEGGALTGGNAWGIGFLVGYFSDSAIAKLREVADTIFATSRSSDTTERIPKSEEKDGES